MSHTPALRLREVTPADYAAITALKNQTDAPHQREVANQLAEQDSVAYLVEINGNLAGYIIYKRDNLHEQNSILDLVAAPDLGTDSTAVQKALVDLVKRDLSPDGRKTIVVYTSSTNSALLDYFSQHEPTFSKHKAAGTDHVMLIHQLPGTAKNKADLPPPVSTDLNAGFPGSVCVDTSSFFAGDTTNSILPDTTFPAPSMDYLGNYSIIVGSGVPQEQPPASEDSYSIQQDEADDLPSPATFRKLSKAALTVQARAKLAELTRMEWETVTLGNHGKLIPTTLNNLTDGSEIYFSTTSKVLEPRRALASLCSYLGQKNPKTHASKLDKPAQITIPASWFRQTHVELGKPGALADAFVPASTQLRYQCADEVEERRQRKTGSFNER